MQIDWHVPLTRNAADRPAFGTQIGVQRLDVFHVDGGTLWEYPDETRFWVSAAADHVRCEIPAHFVRADAMTYLLGPILSFVLRQRGVSAVHASTVRIGEATVALAGPAGAGKSTLTAALVRRGAQLVSEDVSAIRLTEDGVDVFAGVPFIKLWPDSAAQHGELPLLTPNWEKRYLLAETVGGPGLSHILFLETGTVAAVAPMTPREALVALVDNTHVSYALTAAQRAADLDLFGAVIERTQWARLTRTEELDATDALCALVEKLVQ